MQNQILLTLLWALLPVGVAMAQEPVASQRWECAISFRVGSDLLLKEYKNNSDQLNTLHNLLRRDNIESIDSLIFIGTTSPEGSQSINQKLATNRANNLWGYLTWKHPLIKKIPTRLIASLGRWDELLDELRQDQNVPNQEEATTLLEEYHNDPLVMNLISHRSPAAASYIQRNILSPKRNVTACVIYYSASNKEVNTQKIASAASEIKSQTPADTTSKITAPEPDATVATLSTTTSTETSSLQPLVLAESSTPIVTSKKRPHHPIFALKTDLLLWAGVMPNFKLGAWSPNLTGELYFARRWSVQFGWSYANWNALYGSKELHAISAGDLEARFWLGKASQFKGFFVGTYGIFGDYDIQQGINNTLQANTGTFWSAGVGVGWLLPLSRCWALEGQLRGGYRSASNKLYDKVGEYHCLNSRNEANVFDVQLRVNIVWRFNSTKQ